MGEATHSASTHPPHPSLLLAPGHQLRQYYRYGNVDDCSTCWTSLWGCLSQRTRFADTSAAADPTAHPLWRLRSPEEARVVWEAEFGGGVEGGDGDGGEAR